MRRLENKYELFSKAAELPQQNERMLVKEFTPNDYREFEKVVDKTNSSVIIGEEEKNEFDVSLQENYGKKLGKHAEDYGLSPSSEEDRETFRRITNDIVKNSDEIVSGDWRGQEDTVLFHIKGNDVVVTKKDLQYVTTLKDGVNNVGIKKARGRKI